MPRRAAPAPAEPFFDVIIGLERLTVLVLRWSGIRRWNVAATFESLREGSGAVRALAQEFGDCVPAVSTLVVQTGTYREPRLVAVVGIHCDDAATCVRGRHVLQGQGATTVRSFSSATPSARFASTRARGGY
ncbi:MAG TPA: hypothetical protein VGQ20_02895 [Acidimicrobiales bacterium]|jgi:hypothetical protein|nr:hypothetical protein [Acidimicrobiales bacterium]